MAHFSINKLGKHRAQVERAGVRQSKTFQSLDEARDWAEKIEARISRKKQLANLMVGLDGPSSALRGLLPARVLKALSETPYSHKEILAAATPCETLVGVYFLINDETIVYVGQSTDVLRRVSRHRDNGIQFDSYSIIYCAKEEMDSIESMYIDAFLPKYNRATPSVAFKRRAANL